MLTLKPATEKDFLTIEKLAHSIWHKHYVPIVGVEQVNYMLAKMYTQPALQKQTEEGQQFYLVINDEKESGFISISSSNQKDLMLHKFYILQERQNTGLGTLVFNKITQEVYTPTTVRLTVNRQNFKSINFYFKVGFKIEKIADFDIGNNYFMNDFVMLWQNKKMIPL
ncbi:MAG: GNAT family N-acetyltransferase [Bacteroidia bacterium]